MTFKSTALQVVADHSLSRSIFASNPIIIRCIHLIACQQRRQAKIGRVSPDGDGPDLPTVQGDGVYLPCAGVIGTKHYFPAVGRENGIRDALHARLRREQRLLSPVRVDEARRAG